MGVVILGRLTSAAKHTSDHRRMYVAMRNDLAERAELATSDRDYAALIKSLVTVEDRLATIDGVDVTGKATKARKSASHHTSPLDRARGRRGTLRVVSE